MISPETRVQIRRYFYAEHWKIGTIGVRVESAFAHQLGLHADTVRLAIKADRFHPAEQWRASILDPYLEFVRQTLDQYPQLRATRLYQMIDNRGYTGSVEQLRRAVARMRPKRKEAFLRLHTFPAEQAQADWANFGHVMVGPRVPCSSAVLERGGDHIHFNPRLLDLAGHYHFVPRPCQVRAGNQKGRVERAIRSVRDSFWAGRTFTTLEECNRQAIQWRDQVALQRQWPSDHTRSVAYAFDEERPRVLPLPLHPFHTDCIVDVHSAKTIYVRFDLNDYSIPPEAVGRALILAASDTEVRVLDGAVEIARHLRSYGRQQSVLDPAHQDALLELKRKASHSTPGGRLAQAAPECEQLLDRAFQQGESAGSQTAQLLKFLDLYGAPALRRAVAEALARNTPRASSVAFLLRKQKLSAPPLAVDLSRYPLAQAIDFHPHWRKSAASGGAGLNNL